MFLKNLLMKNLDYPDPSNAPEGRSNPIDSGSHHFVSGQPLHGPYPEEMEVAQFGLGCFWGAERKFWQVEGVHVTAVGYSGGHTPNPTYKEVCSGRTGHTEIVLVVYDPKLISFTDLLKLFWESHNPTQGMRQGNDVGTQYRSAIYTYTKEQRKLAHQSMQAYQDALNKAGISSAISTEILDAPAFYFAEEYHQQYLEKNPSGYCGIGGTGVSCPA